ncbi:hypothetical protein F4604DRAFT_1882211 [Suillus subluteus]|nr:hypothetical protein F4604DRAFT_1882211 [Suillus subluteus]
MYSCNIIECIKALYSDPEFLQHLNYAPKHHYVYADKTIRMYHDIHTGKWWWSMQKELKAKKPGATVIPIILFSDKTQVTMFRNKSAYPPLKVPGKDGVTMASGDGVVCQGHPIVTCYSADYPKQLLTTGIKSGECPKCNVLHEELGSPDVPAIIAALSLIDEDHDLWRRVCQECGIKPIFKPFWLDLPHTNIFQSITLDMLHQLYQGIVKHLIKWIKEAYSEAEIDAHCCRLPPNHNICFLSHVSGTEHNQICHFLPGIVIGIQLPRNLNNAHLTHAVRAILNFLYLAQYPCHTEQTLALLDNALTCFHNNKDIFLDLGIRSNFNLPKLHGFHHYVHMIKLYGTTDNYNTKYTECLHIDLTKDAYRATNHKDVYSQMMLWLERWEKILWHNNFVRWHLVDMDYCRAIKMTKHPTVKRVQLDCIVQEYGTTFFTAALAHYIVGRNHPEAAHIILPFDTVATFHRIKFNTINAHGIQDSSVTVDLVHCQPSQEDKRGDTIPAHFDTVLVNEGDGGIMGVDGYCVMQVHVIFMLTNQASNVLFHAGPAKPPTHFAYVEWFTPFQQPELHHGLYKVSRLICHGERLASVIDISDICRSIYLIPNFGAVAPREWTSSTVLECCSTFFLNSFSDRHAYLTIV